MADEEHRVIYRAVADFTNLAVEAAKAEQVIDSLGTTQARASQKAAESERALATAKRDSAKAEHELSQASQRHLQDAAKLDQANKGQAASNQQLWLATRKQVEELSKAAKAQQDYYNLLRAGRGVMTEGAGRLEAPGRVTREGEAFGQQGLVTRQQARDASQTTRSARQEFLEQAERVHQEMLGRNAQQRQPAYQRGLQEATPREPAGVWNDQALFDALISSEGKLTEASKTAEGALGRQRKTTKDKGGDVRALTGELDKLTGAEARHADAAAKSTRATRERTLLDSKQFRDTFGKRVDEFNRARRQAAAMEEEPRGRPYLNSPLYRKQFGEQTAAVQAQKLASVFDSPLYQQMFRQQAAQVARLPEQREKERQAQARDAERAEAKANRPASRAPQTLGEQIDRDRDQALREEARREARHLQQAKQESARAERAAQAIQKELERAEKAEQKRRESLGPLGILGEAFQATARLSHDAAQRHRLGRPGVQRGLALAREDVEPAPAAGAGGGGGGAIFGNILGGFSEFADSVSSGLVKMIPKILNWRALIIAAIAAAGPLVALLGSLGAVAIGAGNGLISLAGSTAALPGLFAAGAAAIGALAIAMAPLVSVFKAYEQQQKLANAGTAQTAETMREANHKVSQAQHAYLDASRGIVEAQFAEQRAQVSLNEARLEATRQLEDLATAVSRASLDEHGAQLAVQQAEADYRKIMADGNATLLERQEAQQRYELSLNGLADTQRKNQRNEQDLAIAQQKGVEGSDQVVDARHAVAQATKGVSDASYQLKTAVENLAQAQKEQAAGGAAMLQANNALAGELEKLGPKTRTVVEHFLGMGGVFKNLQRQLSDNIFGPLAADLGRIDGLMPVVNRLLGDAATALGKVFQRGVEMVSSGPWKADFAQLAQNNAKLITTFGDAGLYVADAFRNITMAAAPFTQWVADAVKKVAAEFDKWSDSARKSGGIADFLKITETRLTQVGKIIYNLFSVFKSLFFASSDFTGSMFDGIVKVTQGWAEWAKAQEGTGSSFRKWLDDVKPLLGQVWTFIVEVAKAFAHLAANPDNIKEAKNILKELGEDILPKLVKIFDGLSQSQVISKLLHDIGIFLGLIADAVGSGGSSGVFKALVDGALAFGAVMAAITAVTLIAKFSGLLALFRGIAGTWSFFLANKGKLGQAFKDLATDLIFGRGRGGTAARRVDSQNPIDEGGIRERGTYTGQFTRLIAQLDQKIELEIEMNGLLRSILAAVEKISLTEPRTTPGRAAAPGRSTPTVEPGVQAEEGAAGRLDTAATALDGAASRLDVAAEQLIAAARMLRTGSLLNDLPGGRLARTAEKDAVVLAEEDAVKVAAKPGLLRRMFSWLPGVSKEATVAKDAGEAGKLARFGRAGLIGDPFTIPGLAASFAADSGWLGRRGSAGKQTGQAAGAILTGAGIGAGIGALGGPLDPITVPVGAAIGAVVGGGYSLYKDKGLRKRLTPALGLAPAITGSKDPLGDAGHDFMTGLHALGNAKFWDAVGKKISDFTGSIGQKFSGAWSSVKNVFHSYVSGPIETFFTKTVPGFFSSIGEKAVRGFDAVKNFFTHTLPSLPGRALAALGHINWEEVGVKVGAAIRKAFIFVVVTLPKDIGHALSSFGKVFEQHVVKPTQKFVTHDIPNFFTKTIPHWFVTARRWWDQHVVFPVLKFLFVTLPNFFTQTIPRWFEAAPHWFLLHVVVPLTTFVTHTLPNFFTQTIPHWFASASHWWDAHVVSPIQSFVTQTIPNFFTQTIPHWFEGVWSWFMTQVVHPVEDWLTHLPGKIWDAIKRSAPAQFIKGLYEGITGQKKQSGGLVRGVYQGRDDTEPHWLSIDEYVMRRDISQQPHGKRMLDDINNKRVTAADFYTALDRNTRPNIRPVSVPVNAVPAVMTITHHHQNTRTSGMSIGDITINNPIREKSTTSMRRQLHAFAHIGGRP
jgi:hypothetical protein